MTISDAIFRATLRRLEANFTVSLVAAFSLRSFDHLTPTDSALDAMRQADFSQAPVTQNDEIVGVIDVATPDKGGFISPDTWFLALVAVDPALPDDAGDSLADEVNLLQRPFDGMPEPDFRVASIVFELGRLVDRPMMAVKQ